MTQPEKTQPEKNPAAAEGTVEPATERLILVGGKRHGEVVEVPAGAPNWVDLLAAETFYRRPFAFARRDPSVTRVTYVAAYQADALVHEDIAQNQQLAQAWWQAIALTRLFEAVGREVPIRDVVQGPSPNGHGPQQHGPQQPGGQG